MKKTVMSAMLAAVVLGGCAGPERVERMQTGPFEPTWESLSRYETPEWFRDAKFGIWAHWGPQCAPERGDWYARFMYMENAPNWAGDIFTYHRQRYGHPSQFGFKDVIHTWKAENWDPDKLLALYKRVGARYFVALANHHDNFDNWDSKYQPWNSVNVGPKKDLIAGWAEAARRHGLRFGVSVHASHAWTWYEPSQGADKTGPYAGVPYDGKLTKADGKGLWWEGLDPQDLYAQNHPRSADAEDPTAIHRQWEWGNGASIPDEAYCRKFYNRTLDLLNRYRPDLIYFDDTALPLYPVSDVGLRIAAHFYNSSIRWNKGKLEAVLNGKVLTPEQRKCMVWDIERGASPQIEPLPWQTCTCLGSWHYDRRIYEEHRYKSAKTVIQMLVDIVSKNGNLLLSVPLRSDGSLDAEEERILEEIAAWMDVNGEAIYATRPWKVFGEGPAMSEAVPIRGAGFNEGRGRPLTAEDVRYTVSKDGRTLYVFLMGRPAAGQTVVLKTLRLKNPSGQGRVSLLGWAGPIDWNIDSAGRLTVNWPEMETERPFDAYACVFKVSGFEMDVQAADAGEKL
ncbi:MAG TPA: alpha-L-fucosidase [Anaerohalosphaeraceae bacterium]|mgnify:CR=1 FL=1|nr:alpha-L-fucosidase [Anaerohalosphaeraceae bacterium]HOL89593.1 alpha-L-fucosidase [Anaerohalosphaeraceae bacterium]HPP55091.1 alpha-L-fucosidase [Anaerohalosphaeraceae bacterium]